MRRAIGIPTGLLFATAMLGACQTIIGISRYEIDPALDAVAGAADGGNSSDVGGSGAGERGEAGGQGGAAGAPEATPECVDDGDCDDTIDCTIDACEDGVCRHTAEDLRCFPEAGECLRCRLGIGCVAAPAVVQELLLDASFDAPHGDWDEHSDGHQRNLFVEEGAHSGTRIARFGPSLMPESVEEYADLSQPVTIPAHTTSLRLSGYYEQQPGSLRLADTYVAAALYELGELTPATDFHQFRGTAAGASEWTPFTYDAPRKEVLALREHDLTFDLVARTYDSVYRFDTLSLQATICE